MPPFTLRSEFRPAGDQPAAIEQLTAAVQAGDEHVTLLGATGTGKTFTIAATYDSTKETGAQDPVTIQTLDDLADAVAFLVTATAPPSGAAVPGDGSVQLSGGADGLAANGLLYT